MYIEAILVMSISVLIPYFFNKMYTYYYGRQQQDELNNCYNSIEYNDSRSRTMQNDKCKILNDTENFTNSNYNIVIGLALAIIGAVLFKRSAFISCCLILSGCIMILKGVTMNWDFYKENMQIIILGIVIFILSYIGYNLNSIKNKFN